MIWAVIPAAGTGKRFGADRPKQYLPLAGRPMLARVLDLFLGTPSVDGLVVALAARDAKWPRMKPGHPVKPLVTAIGGANRAASVVAALEAISDRVAADDWVLVHDAARPCLAPADLERMVSELREDPVGGILAASVVDTLKRADGSGRVETTVARDGLWHAQTPQMFRYGLLERALDEAIKDDVAVTDEAMAMERAGFSPRLVAAREANLKVTRPEDLMLAEAVLAARGMIESAR